MEYSAYCSDGIMELAKAILKVQLDLQPAIKDAENTFSKSRYATLNSVMEVCRNALISNGIWLTQYPVPVEAGHMGLVTKLTHAETGQWQSGLMMMPLPKSDPQGYGSAMTYARRYALSAMLGIVTEEDDDGLGALPTGTNSSRKRQASAQSSQSSQPALQPAPQLEKCAPAKTDASCSTSKHAQAEEIKPVGEVTPFKQEPQELQTFAPTASTVQTDFALQSMPKLDGIEYTLTTTKDGKTCILATGNTSSKKQILSQAGFTWSEQRKVWWRYADVA